jgi:two-component system probable response regulator PhcQ
MKRLLVVDDDPLVVSALKATFQAMFSVGLRVEAFTDPEQALTRMRDIGFDVVMSDYRMPNMDGIEFLRLAGQIQPHIVRMMLSASSDFDIVQQAINEVEVYRYMAKPWSNADLFRHVNDALCHAGNRRSERELANAMRVQKGVLSPAEQELRRLEEQEPGLTVVEWGPNGEVLMPDLLVEADKQGH